MIELQVRAPATATWVPGLRHVVAHALRIHGLGEGGLSPDVALAVTEACSNTVRHAYPTGPGEITLEMHLASDTLTIVISDEGVGLDAETPNAGAGFGLTLIRALSEASIHSQPGRTRLEMRFPLTRGAAVNAEASSRVI